MQDKQHLPARPAPAAVRLLPRVAIGRGDRRKRKFVAKHCRRMEFHRSTVCVATDAFSCYSVCKVSRSD